MNGDKLDNRRLNWTIIDQIPKFLHLVKLGQKTLTSTLAWLPNDHALCEKIDLR
jgi:hypothetical protein